MSGKQVNYALIYQLAQMAYKSFLRAILVKAIEDPESEWDDVVLKITDSIFGYSGE